MAESRMDNPEKLAIVGTQDTGRRQTKQKNITQKTIKDEQHGPHQNLVVSHDHILYKKMFYYMEYVHFLEIVDNTIKQKIPHCRISSSHGEIERDTKSTPLTHIYVTSDFPGLTGALLNRYIMLDRGTSI